MTTHIHIPAKAAPARDVRRNVIKAELRDGIRVGQAEGERLYALRGKVGIFTADNRFRFSAMRHVVTQGTQKHHVVINQNVECLAQPRADLQQVDDSTGKSVMSRVSPESARGSHSKISATMPHTLSVISE